MKKILILIPYYNLYPPMNGGMQRCFHILHQLAKHSSVTAMVFQKPEELLKAADIYPAIRSVKFIYVPNKIISGSYFSKKFKKIRSALVQRWYTRKINDSADSIFLSYLPYVGKILTSESFDVIILENLSTVKLSSYIRRRAKNAKIYYDAHNFDSHLAAIEYRNNTCSKRQYKKVLWFESSLRKIVDGVFVCSNVDGENFAAANSHKLPIFLIPNGVLMRAATHQNISTQSRNFTVLFCGSLDYDPNADGLCWFLNQCWQTVKQHVPESELVIIGSGQIPDKVQVAARRDGVKLIGRVHDTVEYYNKSAVAIVPIRKGSGTRLKVMEAMERKVPVVSTTVGAEGINYSNTENILIADTQVDFCAKVVELLLSPQVRSSIAQAAYDLVERKYSWDTIGRQLNGCLTAT